MKLRLDGLSLQILGLIILPFSLLLLVFALFGVRVHQQAMRRLVAERDERSSRAASAAISQQLHHRQAAIHGLALRLDDDVPPGKVLEQVNFLADDFDGGMAIIGIQGEIIESTTPVGIWTDRPLVEILSSLGGENGVFSKPFQEGEGNMLVLAGARSENELAVGAFSVNNLMRAATLGPISDSESYSAFLADQSGRLLVSVGTSPVQEDLIDHAGVQAALRGESGSSFLPAVDGEHVVAFSPVLPTGWALIIEEPWEGVASPILDLSLVAPLALIPALFVSLGALWFGARRVIEPLRRLEQKTDNLAEGEFEALEEPVGGIAEIRHLQQTFVMMTRRIRAAQQALRGYIETITRTQEDERRRIARELHDETIQDLIALDQQIQLTGINLRRQGLPDAKGIQDLHQTIQEAIQRVRRFSRGLRPIYLEDLGLIPALEMLARDMQSELKIPVSFRVEGSISRLQLETELALYRMVQEALSNISRHAKARYIGLEVAFEKKSLRITVRDDGIGFTPPGQVSELAHEDHYGLIGMYERAELIQAQLEILSSPGQGTTVVIQQATGSETR
jgi:signal transduction histidine kinase